MSAAESPREDVGGQLVVDGIPVKQRTMALQGQLHVDPDLYAQLRLHDRVRVTLELNVASRRDNAERDKYGDDGVSRVLGLGVHATRSFEVIERDTTPSDAERVKQEEKAQRQAESEDARAQREAAAAGTEEKPKKPRKAGGARGARRERAKGLRPVDDAKPDDDKVEPDPAPEGTGE